MKKTLSLIAFFASIAAQAAPCITNSNGVAFFDGNYDSNISSFNATTACVNAGYTNPVECHHNLQCGPSISNPYPSGYITCSAPGNNTIFDVTDTDAGVARARAIDNCQKSAFPFNASCAISVACRDSGLRQCKSYSRGFSFESGLGFNEELLQRQVMEQCARNIRASNRECQVNMTCGYTNAQLPVYHEQAPAPIVVVAPAPAPRPVIVVPAPRPPRVIIEPRRPQRPVRRGGPVIIVPGPHRR